MLSVMANSVDPDETASSDHFVRHFGVQNFRTSTISTNICIENFIYIFDGNLM